MHTSLGEEHPLLTPRTAAQGCTRKPQLGIIVTTKCPNRCSSLERCQTSGDISFSFHLAWCDEDELCEEPEMVLKLAKGTLRFPSAFLHVWELLWLWLSPDLSLQSLVVPRNLLSPNSHSTAGIPAFLRCTLLCPPSDTPWGFGP